MKSNLDVWAIQYYPEELLTALKNIDDGINIIYSNLLCKFKIGNKRIRGRNFDTVLYNETSDILILLMTGGKVSKENIINFLEENQKQYVEVTFDPENISVFEDKDNMPELCFARDLNIIEDAIKDSISMNIANCVFYPMAYGTIELKYVSKNCGRIEIDGRFIQGIIKFDDKIIMITDINNISLIALNSLMKKYNINMTISYEIEPYLYEENISKKLQLINKNKK